MNLEEKCTQDNICFVDIGNQSIKFGIKINERLNIFRIENNELDDKKINKIIEEYKINKFIIGSVCKKVYNHFISIINNKNIAYQEITNIDFFNKLKINNEINFNEIGIDILSSIYYIINETNKKNFLFICFGTATVAVKYTNQIEDVFISNNFIDDYKKLLDILKIDKLQDRVTFKAKNTIDALNASRSYIINGYINEILEHNTELDNIIISGGNGFIFKEYYINKHNLDILHIDETTLKGYFLLKNN